MGNSIEDPKVLNRSSKDLQKIRNRSSICPQLIKRVLSSSKGSSAHQKGPQLIKRVLSSSKGSSAHQKGPQLIKRVLSSSKGSSAHQKVLKQFLSVCSRGIWENVDVLHRVVCTEIFPHVSLDCTVPSLHNTGFFFIFS